MTIQHRPDQAPDKSKTYALVNNDGSVADWFTTHAEAIIAMGKTSKAERSFSDPFFSLSPVEFEFAEGDGVWIEALEAREYHTDSYGVVPVTVDKLNNLAASVKNKVRGIALSTDYNHGQDAAKGSKASGTIHDAKVEGNKLLLNVAFTPTAKDEIKNGEWKYFSSDWTDSYTHEDGTVHTDVLLGGGLTNRPVAKSLNPLPINFSELYDEKGFQFAKLTYQQRNNLKDSQFLYIAPDGTRHLPVPDENHVRAAITRLSQSKTGTVGGDSWLTESLRKTLLAKARRMLGNKKSMSEVGMDELLKRLCESLGVQFSEDADQDELAEKCFAELKKELEPLKQLRETTEKQKTFAEMFPEQARQMEEDRKFRIEANSRTFSETIGTKRFTEHNGKKDDEGNDIVITTSKGLSAAALDKIRETHLKFAEGTVTVEDFSNSINAIMENGIVDYGEVGSSTQGDAYSGASEGDVVPTGDLVNIRHAFAEKVSEVRKEMGENTSYNTALVKAAEKYPKLYDAYMGNRSVA